MNSTAKNKALNLGGVKLGTRFIPGGMSMYFWHVEEREDRGDTELSFMINKAVFLFSARLSVHQSDGEENIDMHLRFSGNGSVSLPIAIQVSEVVKQYTDRDPNVDVKDITYAASEAYWLSCHLLMLGKEVVAAINHMRWLLKEIMAMLSSLGAVYVSKV